MNIWVDADACPVVIKEILYRAANREKVTTTLVANQYLTVPKSPFIKFLQVQQGFDVADNEIVRRCSSGDLVITADIPLASEVIDKNAHALNPRGELYTTENIKSRLNIRDFMDTMRASGIESSGPPPLNQKDRQQFANNLDKLLNQAAQKWPQKEVATKRGSHKKRDPLTLEPQASQGTPRAPHGGLACGEWRSHIYLKGHHHPTVKEVGFGRTLYCDGLCFTKGLGNDLITMHAVT